MKSAEKIHAAIASFYYLFHAHVPELGFATATVEAFGPSQDQIAILFGGQWCAARVSLAFRFGWVQFKATSDKSTLLGSTPSTATRTLHETWCTSMQRGK